MPGFFICIDISQTLKNCLYYSYYYPMIFKTSPSDFNKEIDVVACYVQYQGEFILLHRQTHKTNGNTWGLPAGKVDPGESIAQAMSREIREETGILIEEEDLVFFDSIFVRNHGHDIHYHMYSINLLTKPEVQINPTEHQNYMWVSPQQALTMDLVHDLDECITMFDFS